MKNSLNKNLAIKLLKAEKDLIRLQNFCDSLALSYPSFEVFTPRRLVRIQKEFSNRMSYIIVPAERKISRCFSDLMEIESDIISELCSYTGVIISLLHSRSVGEKEKKNHG